jgi:hypothetical protein
MLCFAITKGIAVAEEQSDAAKEYEYISDS